MHMERMRIHFEMGEHAGAILSVDMFRIVSCIRQTQ